MQEIAQSMANQLGGKLRPAILGIAISPAEYDSRGGVSCTLGWLETPFARACGRPPLGGFGGNDGDGQAFGDVPWW